ncbi:MAG: hypothetical protein FWG97_02625 [Deltaproteobacteria bacterium]|nr:hypothetical protein [Deltaproteobacteria bacterium]
MTVNMNTTLTVQDFRTQSAQLSNANLEVNQDRTAVRQRGSFAWIRSLLNIGDGDTTVRTLVALRSAVFNDQHYARIKEQADAMIGRLVGNLTLKGRQITQVLDQLDAMATTANEQANAEEDARTITANKNLVYSRSIHFLSNDSALGIGQVVATAVTNGDIDQGFTLGQADEKKLRSLISKKILEQAGDFRTPLSYDDIKNISEDTTYRFAVLRSDLDKAGLPPNYKEVLEGGLIKNNALISREQLNGQIENYKNLAANAQLQKSLTDISNPLSPLRAALAQGMTEAGIEAEVSLEALKGLGNAISKAIKKAEGYDAPCHRVSAEEGAAMVKTCVNTLLDAYRHAGGLGQSPAETATLQRLALTSPTPVTAAYLEALAERAGNIPPAALTALGRASTPAQLLTAVANLTALVDEGLETLPPSLRAEGADGYSQYREHCLDLVLARTGLDPPGARALLDSLNTPMAKEVRDLLQFKFVSSAFDKSSASSMEVFRKTVQVLAQAAGIDVDAFMQAEAQRPIPDNASAFSVDVRSCLPDFQYCSGNVPVTAYPDAAARLKAAVPDFAADVSRKTQIQMGLHTKKLDGTSTILPGFEGDIVRDGLAITLGGITLRKVGDIPESELLQPGESGLDAGTLNQRREQAALDNGYNAFTGLVAGQGARFNDLEPQDKVKVLILTSLANQEPEKAMGIAAQRAVSPQAMSTEPGGFVPSYHHAAAQRALDIHINPNGDFVLRLHNHIPVRQISWSGTSNMQNMDTGRSGMDYAATLTISGAEMDRLSQLNWNGAMTPDHDIAFSDVSLAGSMQLYS